MLERQIHVRAHRRIQNIARRIFFERLLVIAVLHHAPAEQPHLQGRIRGAHGLDQRIRLAQYRVGLRLRQVRLRRGALQNRVEIRRDRAHLLDRRVAASSRAAASPAAAQSGALRAAVHAHAGIHAGNLRAGARHPANRPSGLRPFQRRLRQQRSIPVRLQPQIVLNRQRDRILHRQVQLPRPQQAVQPARIVQPHARHRLRPVRTQDRRPLRLLNRERQILRAALRHQARPGNQDAQGAVPPPPLLRPTARMGSSFSLRTLSLRLCASALKGHPHFPTPGAGSVAGMIDSLCTCPASASSIEMWLTSSVRPIAISNAIRA